MADIISLILRTGPFQNEGEDKRTLYSGRVNLAMGSTYKDDNWTKTLYNGKQEKLYFGLHVSQAHLDDIVEEIENFKKSYKEKIVKESIPDFLNRLRRNYIKRMPKVAEGNIVYAFVDDFQKIHFRHNEEVTHKERRD
jgi:hypothetical protein